MLRAYAACRPPMNAGATFERVYDGLKHRLLSGKFAPGVRLDPASLADVALSSVTPIRDALNVLTGEALVEARQGEGYFVPHVNEPGLRDRYAWHGQLVALLLSRGQATLRTGVIAPSGAPEEPEDATALFTAIASLSPNIEHERAVRAAGDRLHWGRYAEPLVFPDGAFELAALGAALSEGDLPQLRLLSARYHRRRQSAVMAMVRAVYRGI